MSRAARALFVLSLLSGAALAQADAALVERLEAADGPGLSQVIDDTPVAAPLLALLQKRADARFQAAEFDLALRLNTATAALAVRGGYPREAAHAYRAIGLCYRRLGRQQESLRANEQGLKYSIAAGDNAASAELYRGAGLAHRALGNNAAAIEAYRQSIEFSEQAQDHDGVLKSMTNLGGVYSSTGDFRRAAEILHRGLAEAVRLDSPMQLGMLNNLAVSYASQGDAETARVYFERLLVLARSRGATADTVHALANLVPIYREFDLDLARRTVEEGLRLAAEIKEGRLTATLHLNLAGIERERKGYPEALRHAGMALQEFQNIGQRGFAAACMAAIAGLHADMRHDAEGLEWAEKAAAEARATGLVNVLWHALQASGRIHRQAGRRDQARAAFEEQIALSEAARRSVAGGETLSVPLTDSRVNPHYNLMELAVEDGRYEAALDALEGSKARVLVDVLENGRADLSKYATETERREEHRLLSEVDAGMRAALLGKGGARERWDSAKRDLNLFRMALYSSHPELKLRRGQFAPFRVSGAELLLPDSHTALVEFALSGDRIYAFVLTRQSGGQPRLTVTTSEWRAADAAMETGAFRRSLAERRLAYRAQAQALFRRVFGPIAHLLRGKTLLGIVPDGVLWSTPLHALIQPNGRHVLEDHSVFYAPSLTALREIRQRRARQGAGPAGLLAIGAPAAGTFAGALAPLPDSGREVRQIGTVYGTRSSVYVDAAARKDVWASEAQHRDVLHLATHAVLNANNPLYSYLVMSDGVLEAREILDSELHAQLVVLSSCETGLGRMSSGEGLIGMSWALLVAGSSAAAVSQWKVPSRSTAELMLEFHRQYRAAGLPVGQALQRAALATMRIPEFRHPHYWAGFVVVGAGY